MKERDVTAYTPLSHFGEAANIAARRYIIPNYRLGKSEETLRRQLADIAQFETYLAQAGFQAAGAMAEDLALWVGVTHGLVVGFQEWQIQHGFAIGTVNVRVTTVKTYCRLANQALHITAADYTAIMGIKNISRKAGRNIDENRELKGQLQRVGEKKAKSILLSEAHMGLLKRKLRDLAQADASVARDYLLLCLLADHGLRCGEVAGLETHNLDMLTGCLVFYRRKVDKTQTHRLTSDTLEAAHFYIRHAPPGIKLFRGYNYAKKDKPLRMAEQGLSPRAINAIVGRLGMLIGVEGLSPHDLRHYWATIAVRKGTNIKALQQAGGWNSPYMPLLYAEEAEIANQDVKLT